MKNKGNKYRKKENIQNKQTNKQMKNKKIIYQ